MRRTERTEGVGRAEARELARGPSWRRTAGSVGRAVMPAKEALRQKLARVTGKIDLKVIGRSYNWRSCETSACRLLTCTICLSSTYSTGTVHAVEDATKASNVRVDLCIMQEVMRYREDSRYRGYLQV